jgi:hypothetical protein
MGCELQISVLSLIVTAELAEQAAFVAVTVMAEATMLAVWAAFARQIARHDRYHLRSYDTAFRSRRVIHLL